MICDVIGEAEVNETLFSSTHLREIDNAALNLQIKPVVSKIRGGGSHPVTYVIKNTPVRRGLVNA